MMRPLVIIPYVPPAYGAIDSVGVAILSIKRYFKEDADIVVVGCLPGSTTETYGAQWVLPKEGGNGPHTDMVKRILYALDNYGQDHEGFVLWHDDMIAVNPFSLEDVKVPIALSAPILSSEGSSNYFLNDMHWTLQELKKLALTPINYTTHSPRWYDKDLFRSLVNKYDLTKRGLDFEMLYFNEQCHSPQVLDRDDNSYVLLMSDNHKPPLDKPLWVGLTNDFKNPDYFRCLKDRINQ